MRLAVIGTGSVGGTLGTSWAKHDYDVVFGTRDPSSSKVRSLIKLTDNKAGAADAQGAVDGADIVVLATPWHATESCLRSMSGLSGKVLVDCTNPLESTGLAVGHNASGGELVAGWAKGARVVKAFNSTGYNVMAKPDFDGRAAAMFVCGDDPDANEVVGRLAKDIGFDAVNCGPLRVARYLEPLAALWIHLAYAQGMGREIAFSLMSR